MGEEASEEIIAKGKSTPIRIFIVALFKRKANWHLPRSWLQRNGEPSPAHQCRGCYLPIKVAGLRALSIARDVCGR